MANRAGPQSGEALKGRVGAGEAKSEKWKNMRETERERGEYSGT